MEYSLNYMFGIEEDVVIVTGGCGSIGLEICRGLLQLGANIAAIGNNEEGCTNAKEKLGNEFDSSRFMVLNADITNESALNNAVDEVYKKYKKIDALINCAGINIIKSLNDITVEEFNTVMNVNFMGVVMSCKSVGRYMLKAKKGRVVNISSLSSVQGKAFYTAYSSSKAAINSFTQSLAIEWAKSGINVNAICPSLIVTDINRHLIESNPENFAKRVQSIPRGVAGRVEWLVAPIVCLLSKGSIHLTGQSIFVDGGSSSGSTFVLDNNLNS